MSPGFDKPPIDISLSEVKGLDPKTEVSVESTTVSKAKNNTTSSRNFLGIKK